jgi:microcystin-dependent protein
MLKRFSLALAGLFLLATSAFGAGTLPGFSLSQQMGKDGKPLAGCTLKFYQAGTVATPQTAYQDSGLTIPVVGGSQMTCDTYGRIGQFFLADGSIKILLTDSNGVTQVTADGLLVIGASSGGGGGSPVDPTTILATGDLKVSYGTGVLSGFVRANGRTIGSSTSGGTERANADTQALFLYLWGADANLAVSGGRGASAAADWAANKTITLPDWRGRALAGLDDMGNSAAGRLTATYFGVAATVLGAAGGTESRTLTVAQLPTGITSRNATQSISVGSNTYNIPVSTGGIAQDLVNSGSTRQMPYTGGTWSGISGLLTLSNDITVTSNNTSGSAHATASPMMLATIYLKL